MTHTPDPHLFERPINILVVGCGGNGSAIAAGLPYLHQALLAFGHPGGLNVTLIDPDTVSETNCVRQPFCRTEIGLSKAVVLAHRTNMFWGLSWQGMQAKIEQLKSGAQVDILIGCVDTRKARRRDQPLGRCAPECCIGSIWGTTHLAGSSSLGSPTTRRIERRSSVSRPSPSCIQRSSRRKEQEDDQPSCSAAEALNPAGALHQSEPRVSGSGHADSAAASRGTGLPRRVLQSVDQSTCAIADSLGVRHTGSRDGSRTQILRGQSTRCGATHSTKGPAAGK